MSMEPRTRAKIDRRLGESSTLKSRANKYSEPNLESRPSSRRAILDKLLERTDVLQRHNYKYSKPITITLIYRAFTSYYVDVGDIGWEFKSVDDTTTIEATILGFWNSEPSILIPNHEPLVNTYYIITISRDVWAVKYEYDNAIQEGSTYPVDGKSGITTRKEGENTTYCIDNRRQVCTISHAYVTMAQTRIANSVEQKPITTKKLTPREEISRFLIRKSVAHVPKNAAILTLPNEISQEIFTYLSKSSGVAFTLTSRNLKTSLGPKHWTELLDAVKICPKETTDLLDLLCRDYEQCISCHTCLRLHEPSGLTTALKTARKCWKHDEKFGLESIIHDQFRFSEIQMAAKLYHEGKYRSSQLQLCSIGRTGDQLINYHRHQLNDPCITHEFRMNSHARIIYRSQYVCLIPHNLPESFSTSRTAILKFISRYNSDRLPNYQHRIFDWEQWVLDPISICGHVGPLHGGKRRSTLSYVGKSLKQWSCAVCGTEYQSNIVNYGSEGLAYVFTKWMDLGRGLH